MFEKYTALCPDPVILATLVSSDSFKITPTSPCASDREQANQGKRQQIPMEQEERMVSFRTSSTSQVSRYTYFRM